MISFHAIVFSCMANYRTREWLRLGETSGDLLVQPLLRQGHLEHLEQDWV